MFSVYSVVLRILHLVCFVYDCVSDATERLIRKYLNFKSTFVSCKNSVQRELVSLQKFEKLPVHLTVLLGTEEPSYKDLANLVVWSLATGISFISFYDHQGILKKCEDKFRFEVDKIKSDKHHVIWHDSDSLKNKNGFAGRKIHVKMFAYEDGRECVVEKTKKLVYVRSNDINIETVDKYLGTSYEFPDPDMGIYCGKTFSLYGYPPWQIRVTEFFNVSTHYNLHCTSFIDLIRRYSKCEKRLGK